MAWKNSLAFVTCEFWRFSKSDEKWWKIKTGEERDARRDAEKWEGGEERAQERLLEGKRNARCACMYMYACMHAHAYEYAYLHIYTCMHKGQKDEREREREREKTKENVIPSAASRGLQESEIDANIRSLLNKTHETKSHRKTSV